MKKEWNEGQKNPAENNEKRGKKRKEKKERERRRKKRREKLNQVGDCTFSGNKKRHGDCLGASDPSVGFLGRFEHLRPRSRALKRKRFLSLGSPNLAQTSSD